MLRGVGEAIGLDVASESALGAGLVMGIMIIPFVSSLSDDVITAVPQALRDGSYGLGATRSETIRRVVLPAALPGIVGAVLLAVSRAIGETMIVVMAAGLAANLTANPLEAVTTVTVQIVTLLIGDQEFDSAEDARGVRARARAVPRDARAQRHRAAASCAATGSSMSSARDAVGEGSRRARHSRGAIAPSAVPRARLGRAARSGSVSSRSSSIR